MECGCLGKRFGASWVQTDAPHWRKFDRFSDKTQEVRIEKSFWQEEKPEILGITTDWRYTDPRQFKMVCNDRNTWFELQRCREFAVGIGLNMA